MSEIRIVLLINNRFGVAWNDFLTSNQRRDDELFLELSSVSENRDDKLHRITSRTSQLFEQHWGDYVTTLGSPL
jgi:hypothetical protein